MSRERLTENPFYVLALPPDCSRADLEREGQKLLAMLELGMAAAKTYATPLGPAARTAESVRLAMAELRDPRRRLMHELWAQLPVAAVASAAAVTPPAADDPALDPFAKDAVGAPPAWPAAHPALGFGVRR